MRAFASVIGLASLALVAANCQAQPQDEATFAAEMLELVKTRFPDVEVTPLSDPLSITVKAPGQEEMTVNFHRIFGFCRNASAADCATTRDELLAKILRMPPAVTPEALRLAVRDRQYVEYIRTLETKKAMAITRQIGEDLFAVLVADSPETVQVVPPDQLATLGMTQEQAWSRAWEQTRKTLPPLPEASKLRNQAFAYQDQEYVASLLIDLAAWAPIAETAGPDLFVTVVADNFVFVGLGADGPKLERFRQSVREDCASQPRCVSPNLYRFRDGLWRIAQQTVAPRSATESDH